MSLTAEQRSQRARIAALSLYAKQDARDVTARARETFLERFEREVDPDRTLPAEERRRRAEFARKAHMARLALLSSQARTAKRAARDQRQLRTRVEEAGL